MKDNLEEGTQVGIDATQVPGKSLKERSEYLK
jgi:hypothetical protein